MIEFHDLEYKFLKLIAKFVKKMLLLFFFSFSAKHASTDINLKSDLIEKFYGC